MSNAGDSSKRAKRDQARETARLEREKERKRRLRNRIIIQSSVGVVVLAIVLVVVLIIVNTNKQAAESATGPGPKNMASGGILFTAVDGKTTPTLTDVAPAATATPTPTVADYSDGLAHIVTYIDWSCPACKSFEASYSDALSQAVAQGTATLEIHPIAILDRSWLGTRYSSRANNAAACMANYDPSQYLTAQTAFYDNQPTEGTTGLTNTQMKKLLTDAGITNSNVMSCIDSEKFKVWVTDNTARVTATPALQTSDGSFATPTVTVDGIKWDSTATPNFGTFVTDAVAQATGGSTSAPTDGATITPSGTAVPTDTSTN